MNKRLFERILMQMKEAIAQSWTEVEFEKLDTTKFKRPNDMSYRFKHKVQSKGMAWSFNMDYNQTDIDTGKTLPSKDRSVSLYFRNTLLSGDVVDRSVHVYSNEDMYNATYTHTLMFDVRVNNQVISSYSKQVDVSGQELYNAIFHP